MRCLEIDGDQRGIPCLTCNDTAVIEKPDGSEGNCPDCTEGRDLDVSENPLQEAVELVLLVLSAREKPWSPTEWLAQPYLFHLVWKWLMPFIVGEFEERRSALKGDG